MPISDPPKIVLPFARNAGAPYVQSPVPDTSAVPGRASYDQGFPPLTMTPVVAGGIPPFGQDVNGLFLAITSYCANYQGGKLVKYDAATAAAQGGYARGAILLSADGTSLWFNQLASNTSDPDAGGANWTALFAYGHSGIATTGGVTTLTALEARRSVIVLTGSLASNAQIVLPTFLQSWLIVNATTANGFTLTVKTASGNGVAVPAGGYAAPVGVYGNGVDINPTVSPLAYPIAVAADPSSIVLRSNIGAVIGTYFNMTTGPQDYPVSNFLAETNDDGYFRKMTPAWFAAQVFQHFDPSKVLAANGYLTLPGGLVVQWGSVTFGDLSSGAYANQQSVSFPTPFQFAVFQVITGVRGDATAAISFARNQGTAGFTMTMEEVAGRSQGSNCGATWIAIGI